MKAFNTSLFALELLESLLLLEQRSVCRAKIAGVIAKPK